MWLGVLYGFVRVCAKKRDGNANGRGTETGLQPLLALSNYTAPPATAVPTVKTHTHTYRGRYTKRHDCQDVTPGVYTHVNQKPTKKGRGYPQQAVEATYSSAWQRCQQRFSGSSPTLVHRCPVFADVKQTSAHFTGDSICLA